MTNKLTVEQRIQRAHVWLMKHPKYCLYSGIFMLGKVSVEDDLPTAATNGRDVFYGREFSSKLPDEQLRAVILHENLHKAFRHLTTWKHLYKENAQLANIACDYVINLLVEGEGVVLPDCALLDPKYQGWDAQQVYKDLKQQAEGGSVRIKTKGDPVGKDVPVDEADSMDGHDWESAEGMSTEEKEVLVKDIDQALRQGAILAGKLGGNVPREITDVLESKVDWREALREFVTSFCQDKDESTWRRPSRRWIGEDVYMPSLIGESVGRIVVAIDTSGSIGPQEIGQFLGEIRKICETVTPEGIDLLYWDTRVAQHEKYERDQLENLLSSTKPRGGGGTAPSCITKYIAKHKLKPECAVVLSDGYVGSDWGGTWPCPVLWGITSDQVSAVGKTVRVQ
jgi:predicted metal-dependent peptidase